MGSCSSVQRNSICSKTVDKLVIPPSPIKEKPKNQNFIIDDVALKAKSSTIFNGSKEESFFDSKGWLDSDCEDDFYSVNGEFTPSRGTTPVHHKFETPAINKTPSHHIVPEPSPTEKKKNLLELFKESVRENQNDEVEKPFNTEEKQVKPPTTIIHDLLTKSAQSTPYISGGNSTCSSIERTMNDENESVKPVQCCFPSLASCRSFSERRRKASIALAANGKV